MPDVRSDGDTWDIATSVGATAVMVALARAAETGTAEPLIRDQFAELLVSAPELEGVRTQVASWWSTDARDGNDVTIAAQQMIDYQAVRTHFFDEFFAAADATGIRQHVIVAAGLDSRAYRLAWSDGAVVYQIDLPKVLEYKAATLATHGAQPTAVLRDVSADLREDWPKALRNSGFDPSVATAWLAEGLLPFLPGAAQASMFARIDELSAPNSRIAVEVFGFADMDQAEFQERWQQIRAERESRGEDVSFDPLSLWYDDDGRPDCEQWFAARGWTTESVTSRAESQRLGRAPQADPSADQASPSPAPS